MQRCLIVFLVLFFIQCQQETIDHNHLVDNNLNPVYYNHDLSQHNANNQLEIEKHLEILNHEKKNEKGKFELLGSWFGKLNENWISLNITSTSNQMVAGYIILDTTFKPFKGWYTTADEIHFKIGLTENNELNKHFYDMSLSLENMTLNGIVQLIDIEHVDSIFLEKRNYEYDVTLGTYPEFSQREISTSELDELSTNELIYITEEILAKHGLIFFNNETRDMFNHKEWYIPLNYRVNNLLTKIERNNLDKIYKYF